MTQRCGTMFVAMGIISAVGSLIAVGAQVLASNTLLSIPARYGGYSDIFTGIWCAPFFFATGIITIVAGNRFKNPSLTLEQQKGLLNGLLGMSITSLIFSIILASFGGVTVGDLKSSYYACDSRRYPDRDSYGYRGDTTTTTTATTAIPTYFQSCNYQSFFWGVILILVAVAQLIISSITFGVCCRQLQICCSGRQESGDSKPSDKDAVPVAYGIQIGCTWKPKAGCFCSASTGSYEDSSACAQRSGLIRKQQPYHEVPQFVSTPIPPAYSQDAAPLVL